MKKQLANAIHSKQRSLNAQPALTERDLRAATGGEIDIEPYEMEIPSKKQKNPG